MPQNPPDFDLLIRALNDEGVSYVIVGGIAMVLHGSDTSTVDTDIAVATEPSNTAPLVRALAHFHPHPSHLPGFRDFPWDARSIYGAVVSLSTDAGDIDLLRVLPGIDSYEGLLSRSETRDLFGLTVRVASIPDLIAMKTAAGRIKDQKHLIELESLAKLKNKKRPQGEP